MGFLQPNLPVVDMAEWNKGSRAERVRPMARHLAEAGFGAPDVVYLAYLVKIGLYVLGGMLFALSTRGIDGFTDVGSWWSEPIVFQKAVFYTMLVEVVGLGCSFGPLSGRYTVPLGSILYWLRPGTVRLPPWSNRVPLTKGTNRTQFDVVLYGTLLILLVLALVSDGSGPIPALDTELGVLPAWHGIAVLAVLAVVGLRDKTIFLATRGEVYGPLALAFLLTGVDAVVAAKLVFLVIWMGAATSKLKESKAARGVMDDLLVRYRTNTTTVLALATGAATFFGFADSPKGVFFLLSIISYGIGALIAVVIYWPKAWRVNAAYNVANGLQESTLTPTKLRWDLALGHQQAIAQSITLVDGRWGLAVKFRALLIAMALVVILAGVNVYQQSQRPAMDKPTHVVIEREIR